MDIKLPLDIAKEVGYKPESNMIAKINRGAAQPSPEKCRLIIKAMKSRGVKVSLFDLRPDLREIVMESL